jgi:hypothetical protein
MTPLKYEPTWIPGIRYAPFEFGKRIAPLALDGTVGLCSPSASPLIGDHRYSSEDLYCHVDVSDGFIQAACTEHVCQYKGFNLIGCSRSRIGWILDQPDIEWFQPEDCYCVTEFATFPDLGLVLEAVIETDAVMIATMSGIAREPVEAWHRKMFKSAF